MALISERISDVVEHVRNELTLAVNQMAAFVELLEKSPSKVVDGDVGTHLTFLSTTCQELNSKLGKYSLFYGDIANVVESTDDLIQSLADRFIDRAYKEYRELSTADAMEHFGRSRSTIYRWIKSGKVQAEKRGRRWVVFI